MDGQVFCKVSSVEGGNDLVFVFKVYGTRSAESVVSGWSGTSSGYEGAGLENGSIGPLDRGQTNRTDDNDGMFDCMRFRYFI